MKRLSKTHLKIIIALNFVLICLMAGLLIWYYPNINVANDGTDDTNEVNGEIPYTYKRVRTAEISLNPYLSWQLDIEGSGLDEVVFTYLDEEIDTFFVFGNTTSSDKDFNCRGIFMIAVDVYGKTKENGFFNYGGEVDVLKKVSLSDAGFLLAVEGIVQPYLLIVGFDGTEIKRIDGFISAFESVDNIRQYADGFLLFTQPYNSDLKIKKLRCSFFDRELSFKGSCLADSSYSLTPVEIVVVSGKPIVFCNASSPLNTLVCAIEFFLTSSAKVNLIHDYPGEMAGFSVNNGDYILLTSYNGSTFLRLNNSFKVIAAKTLSQLSPVYFLDLDNDFYAAFLDGSSAILDYNLMALSAFNHFVPTCKSYINDAVALTGIDFSLDIKDSISIYIFNEGKLIYNATVGIGRLAFLAVGKKNMFCVYHKDNNIIIASLRYPIFL